MGQKMAGSSGTFDFVIVGAGPAGCVLANRLSADPARSVALVEAGPDYGPNPLDWPAEFRDTTSIWPDTHSWGYIYGPSSHELSLSLPRARVVGGTSTINGCIWIRGSAADYDEWEWLGNPGWSFQDLLPYFRMAERDPQGGPLHGEHGLVPVDRAPESSWSTVDRALVEAAGRLGLPFAIDLNGEAGQRPSVGPTPKNIAEGSRINAAFSYLAPARERPNLKIIPDRLVDRVIVENGRATGLQTGDGEVIQGETIILSAGAYGSPAILLRSGIGPVAHLREFGIAVTADLPGVGSNLLDHPLVNGLMECAIAAGSEPSTRSFMPIMVKARSSQVEDEIDLHIYEGQSYDPEHERWLFWLSISLQFARSRGQLRLTSPDPDASLLIDHAYFDDPADLEALCDGVELVNDLVRTPPLSEIVEPIAGRTLQWSSRDELRAKVRAQVGTTYHPSSTCRMGPASDPQSVVDHTGRVHGIDRLMVVDASIFPTGPRGNLHFPTVAVAEKIAAEIIDSSSPQ
jgi:choline dehydrogenase